ncbi:hypothetical protein AHAS_Ahas18G0274400 [Arachis hypogaea]
MVDEESKAAVDPVVTVEFVPWWSGSRIATREEADAEVGTATCVAAEAATATTMGIFLAFCNKLSNKPSEN